MGAGASWSLPVASLLCGFLEKHPEITSKLLRLDRVTSLIEEGIDIAVRIGELPDSGGSWRDPRRRSAACWWQVRPT